MGARYSRPISQSDGQSKVRFNGCWLLHQVGGGKSISQHSRRDVKKFMWKNIVTRFGVSDSLISDNGLQFDSRAFCEFCSELDIKNRYSIPTYPQSNEQAKAINKTIMNGLKKRLDGAKGRWAEELPNILWAYRTTLRRSIGETPFSPTYGGEAVIPTEVNLCNA